MDPQDAIDLSREAIRTCIFVGGPILAASLLIGLVVSLLQSMTQLHDQSISFAPKILLLLVAIGVCLPWLSDQMIEFTKYSLEKPVVFQVTSSRNDSLESQQQTISKFAFQWTGTPASPKLATELALPPNAPAQPAGGMPMLRSKQKSAQPQLRLQPQLRPQSSLQSRVASPFALPAFRAAETEAPMQRNGADSLKIKTF